MADSLCLSAYFKAGIKCYPRLSFPHSIKTQSQRGNSPSIFLYFLDNPFGDEFIKLEIDQDKFNTNKSAPSVHHIPLGKQLYQFL